MLRALSRRATALKPRAGRLELLTPPDGSMPQNRPAADVFAFLPSLSQLQAKQEQQYVSLHPWHVLAGSAAAASQRPASLHTLTRCRTVMTTVPTAAPARKAKPARRENNGPSTGIGAPSSGSSSSSSPAQPCPLHACLLQYCISDLALSQEEVDSNVKPKLAALAAEGLSPKQMAGLMGHKTHPLLSCNYGDTFLPNLQLLRQIGAHIDHRPHPKTPHLTAAGKILTDAPDAAAQYLPCDPSKVLQLLQWLEGSLGVRLAQLAACKDLCNALRLSAGAASAVCLSLQKQQVPAEQVAHMLVRQPTLFNHSPGVLSARLGALQQHLGLDAVAALEVALAYPRLLIGKLEFSLPPLLRFLDGYMGEEGAGRRLVCAKPSLGALTAARAERTIGNLAAWGYSQQQTRGMISKEPTILAGNLDSPLQQQKLDWM